MITPILTINIMILSMFERCVSLVVFRNKDEKLNIKDQLNDALYDLHKNTYFNYKIKNIRYLTNSLKVIV